ncbi:MAG: N-acetyl-gamma-glutamyl-phosphate reductase [Clostridia bacterium]|nr:N-acetyl-gamma-glutamyl-phosphate reductase [Clostridia bacterium]
MKGRPRIFIDGSAGTTGLRIYERLAGLNEIDLLGIPDELRKDPKARAERINSADVVFLCLPDDAAREAVTLVENPETVIIDTSTAHRTTDGWVYGFPELRGQREKIAKAKRIANPGCHAGGFVALVAPLVQEGILPKDSRLDCFSLTGYSGGGKKMIADYEAPDAAVRLGAPRVYGLTQTHKHLPEMRKLCGLDHEPVFCPVVGAFYSGMAVNVPLRQSLTGASKDRIAEVYREYYNTGLVRFEADIDDGGFLAADKFAGRDDMVITVCGEGERMTAIAVFDNLGKGASGAAIQNMNIVLGLKEDNGLLLGKQEMGTEL